MRAAHQHNHQPPPSAHADPAVDPTGQLARLQAALPPSSQALDDEQPHYLWPEHEPALCIFVHDLRTQWRVGMAGATGLDYTAVIATLRLQHSRTRAAELLEQIRTLECATLDERERLRQLQGDHR